MKRDLVLLACFVGACSFLTTQAAPLDGNRIQQLTGLKGAPAGDTFKVTQPRTDVPVLVDGRALPPFMGLTSWAAFADGKSSGAHGHG